MQHDLQLVVWQWSCAHKCVMLNGDSHIMRDGRMHDICPKIALIAYMICPSRLYLGNAYLAWQQCINRYPGTRAVICALMQHAYIARSGGNTMRMVSQMPNIGGVTSSNSPRPPSSIIICCTMRPSNLCTIATSYEHEHQAADLTPAADTLATAANERTACLAPYEAYVLKSK